MAAKLSLPGAMLAGGIVKMSKPHANTLNGAKICGATSKRTGKPCRQPAMANGRCRLHGGKSTGRPVTTGQWTKKAIQRRKETTRLLRQAKELIDSISKEKHAASTDVSSP